MKLRRIFRKRFDRSEQGIDLSADVNAVIAANVGERGSTTHVTSRSRSHATTTPRPTTEEVRDDEAQEGEGTR